MTKILRKDKFRNKYRKLRNIWSSYLQLKRNK